MGWVSRLSFRTKAPAAAALLVLGVGVTISTASYFALRRTLHDHAARRLMNLQQHYCETYRHGMANSRAHIAAAAARPELADFLRDRAPAAESAARAALLPPGPAPEWVLQVELRDASGGVLLTEPGPASRGETKFTTLDAVEGASLVALAPIGGLAIAFGKLQRDGDAVVFPIVARIGAPASGFLVVWRRVATSWQASQQVAADLGDAAAAYMVNGDGSLWSESGRPVPNASEAPSFGRLNEYERAGRGPVLSVSGPMDGTPWAFAFEFPTAALLAPARTFLREVAWIAAACILLGIFAAWLLSRRLTEPVHELTKAADAIAAGDLSRRASIRREDELGRLVRSFNSMAEEAQESRTRLESLVEERTRKLLAVEDSLVRREKLALVGQFAGGIGHEIRNPLGVMSNAISGLELILADATPEVRELLRMLRSQVKLSAKFVNDLLDLARSAPPMRESVNVAAFVGPTLQRCAASGAIVETDIPTDLPAVDVDPVHATQVIDNLLTNALQAMDGKGKVRVKARRMDGFVDVEVSDSGPGVAVEHEARIFEPLFTTKANGTGLGLALSRSLALANGGDLRLASKAGEGARFVLSLKVSPA